MKISGNTILITGGGSGIGLALARAFNREQNTVIIVGRDMKKLTEASRHCPGLHIIKADITLESDRQRVLAEVRKDFSELNVLVNNAGLAFFGDLQPGSDAYENFRQEIETNYLAPVRLIELFTGMLQQQPSAAVINVTTIAVYLPLAIMPGYSASKAALHSFTCSLRRQLANTTIKVFEILPPSVDTEMVRDFHMDKMHPDKLAEKVLTGLRKNHYEMPIAEAGILRLMARLFPGFTAGISHRQLMKVVRS